MKNIYTYIIPYRSLNFEICLYALLNLLKTEDPATFEHSVRVANYAVEIAKEMKLGNSLQTEVFYGALLHDIGKLGIPLEILHKPGKLTQEEYEMVQKHPVYGSMILSTFANIPETISLIALCHHERENGTGYPNGLKGKGIPLSARIVSVADAFDAMTSNRSYRSENRVEAAIREVESNIGIQFDGRVAKAFLRAQRKEKLLL